MVRLRGLGVAGALLIGLSTLQLEFAIERRPRDTANTWQGAVVLRAARAAPRLVDAIVRTRAKRAGMLPSSE